jgi:hypothetical protein
MASSEADAPYVSGRKMPTVPMPSSAVLTENTPIAFGASGGSIFGRLEKSLASPGESCKLNPSHEILID